jgi:structural maintenance of chromosome 3 (chondroitin sulfate proteoglycan 6)
VEDLQAAGERAGGKREELHAELADVQAQINEKEAELAELIPAWEAQKERETTEKRSLDHARSRLQTLYGKQGRLNRFRTKAERDTFLRHEIAAIGAYRKSQLTALETARAGLAATRRSLLEVETNIRSTEENIEESRNRTKDLAVQMASLKNEVTDLTEQRKELWREDTKLQSLVTHAADELRTAERNLASMMDKVCMISM